MIRPFERKLRIVFALATAAAGAGCLALSQFDSTVPLGPLRQRLPSEWVLGFGVSLLAVAVWQLFVRPQLGLMIALVSVGVVAIEAACYRPVQRGDVEISAATASSDSPSLQKLWVSPYDWMEVNNCDDDRLGYVGLPNSAARSEYRDYTVVYHHDAQGRRVTTTEDRSGLPHIAFLGCSCTYGIGVADNEHFPALLARYAWTEYDVQNYGYSGYGTGHAYLIVEDLLKQAEPPALIAYLYYAGHLKRNWLRQSWWKGISTGFPWFEIDESGRPYHRGLATSADATAPDSPDTDKQEDRLTLALLRDIDRRCRERGVPFLVVLFDFESNRIVDDLLTDPNLVVLDYRTVSTDAYPIDYHPTPNWHHWMAYAFARDPRIAKVTGRPDLYQPSAIPEPSRPAHPPHFRLEERQKSTVKFVETSDSPATYRLESAHLDPVEPANVRLLVEPFEILSGKSYHLSFRVAADAPRAFKVIVSDRFHPDLYFGVYRDVEARSGEQVVSIEFTPEASTQTGRIEFQIGGSETPIEFSDIELSCEGQKVAPTEWQPPL